MQLHRALVDAKIVGDLLIQFPLHNVAENLALALAERLETCSQRLFSDARLTFARITRQVMYVGQGSHYEIWDLEMWNQQLETLRSGGSPNLPPGMENFSL